MPHTTTTESAHSADVLNQTAKSDTPRTTLYFTFVDTGTKFHFQLNNSEPRLPIKAIDDETGAAETVAKLTEAGYGMETLLKATRSIKPRYSSGVAGGEGSWLMSPFMDLKRAVEESGFTDLQWPRHTEGRTATDDRRKTGHYFFTFPVSFTAVPADGSSVREERVDSTTSVVPSALGDAEGPTKSNGVAK